MKKGIDIYNYEKKFEATVRTMRSSKITELNKKLIEKFYNFCFANGIGKPRVIKYVRTLSAILLTIQNILSGAVTSPLKLKGSR